MSSVNKVILVGRVGKDPEIRHTNDGKAIVSLSLATSENWKTKDGDKKEKTEWHKIVSFNEGLNKVIEQYVKKGSQIYIEGQLQTRKWTDKDGVEKYSTEIVLQNFNGTLTLLGGKPDGDEPPRRGTKPENYPAVMTKGEVDRLSLDDEVPF
jgi:single-strand DNA-binding protein